MNWTDAFEGIEGMEDMETDRFEDGVPCGQTCEKPIQSLRKRNASYRADYLFIRPKGYRTPSGRGTSTSSASFGVLPHSSLRYHQ